MPTLYKADIRYLGEAVQDRESMKEFAKRGYMNNPFVLTSEKAFDAELLKDAGLIANQGKPIIGLPDPKDLQHPELPGAPWDYESKQRADIRRYLAAISGSCGLILPMILMVLVKGVLVRLLTASVCTIAFALALATGSDRLPYELMAATAAYTSVLVVFVGTTS